MAFLILVILFITFTHLIVGSGEAHWWPRANPLVGKDRCVRDAVVIGSMIDCHLQIHNRTMTRNWIAWNDRSTVVYFQEWNGHDSSKAFIHNESFEKWIFTILYFMSWNEDNDSNSKLHQTSLQWNSDLEEWKRNHAFAILSSITGNSPEPAKESSTGTATLYKGKQYDLLLNINNISILNGYILNCIYAY